jgi:hypothetical protein
MVVTSRVLGVLGVPLIMVPDSSPPSLKGSVGTRLEALSHFFARGPAFLGYILFRVDDRVPFDKGRLVAQRRTPKVPAGDLPDLVPFDRVRGLDASL